MALKTSQQRVLACASCLIFLLGIFPPWARDAGSSGRAPEHSFILTPVREPNGMRYRLDAGMLLAETMIILGAAASWCLLSGRSAARSQSRRTQKLDWEP